MFVWCVFNSNVIRCTISHIFCIWFIRLNDVDDDHHGTKWETTHSCKITKTKCITLCRLCRVFNTQNNWEIVQVMLFVCIIVYAVYQIHLAKFIQLNCFNPHVFFFFFNFHFLFRFFCHHVSLWLVSHIRHTQSGLQHSNKWIRGIYCFSFSMNCVKIFEPGTHTDTLWYSLCTIISMNTIHFQFCYGALFFFFYF